MGREPSTDKRRTYQMCWANILWAKARANSITQHLVCMTKFNGRLFILMGIQRISLTHRAKMNWFFAAESPCAMHRFYWTSAYKCAQRLKNVAIGFVLWKSENTVRNRVTLKVNRDYTDRAMTDRLLAQMTGWLKLIWWKKTNLCGATATVAHLAAMRNIVSCMGASVCDNVLCFREASTDGA